ncbi:MAG: pantoate--beta-alanine ligase [Hyphomicrobium sp.]|nr:MAG: pantoate--beta-alanine ligase [Hyphomicrobium sp.]
MSKSAKIIRSVKDLRKQIAKWRASEKSIALVPTMGALHDGHISLVKLAKKKADRVVVSIFVNPSQFAPTEDLSRYPRDETGDLNRLNAVETDLVWAPDVSEMYPDGFSTRVTPGTTSQNLEGEFRPHHFGGVATVCCKLFSQVTPDMAIFGEKDYQQLVVLRQMVCDLNLPLTLVGAPTRREKDGLALSSRNTYLSVQERDIAPSLYAAISDVADKVSEGADISASIAAAKQKLISNGFTKVDYLEVCDADTLVPIVTPTDRPLRVLVAAWLGKTRLIDNVAV